MRSREEIFQRIKELRILGNIPRRDGYCNFPPSKGDHDYKEHPPKPEEVRKSRGN